MTRLLIFTPTYADAMRPETGESINAQETTVPYAWEVGFHNPYPGEKMRNVVAQYQRAQEIALAGKYDAMLTVEHDMILPADAVQKLWDTDAGVVYGTYMLRHGTKVLNTWQYTGGRNIGMSLSLYPKELARLRQQRVGRVSGVGWGCTLIRREVLQSIPVRAASESDAGDLTFAGDCQRANIELVARFDVECGHIDEDGTVLMPFAKSGGAVSRILAQQNVNISVDGQSMQLKTGRYYSIPINQARELARAGFLVITNDTDEPDQPDIAQRETAIDPKAVKRSTRGKGKG